MWSDNNGMNLEVAAVDDFQDNNGENNSLVSAAANGDTNDDFLSVASSAMLDVTDTFSDDVFFGEGNNSNNDNVHNNDINNSAATTTTSSAKTRSNEKATTTTATSTLTSSASAIDNDIEEITQQMGKIWFPTDLSKTYQRDKHGRLVPSDGTPNIEDGKARKGKGGSKKGNGNSNRGDDRTGVAFPIGGGGGGNKPFYSSSSGSVSDRNALSDSSQDLPKTNYSEWYDKIIASAHTAGQTKVEASLPRVDDPKLQTSLALTKTIDKFWAKELYEMDAKERENIVNEIHGIKSSRVIQETPESVEESVASFRSFLETNIDKELDNGDSIVPPVTKDPYKRGVYELGSDYITSKTFLIKFLRISMYDQEQAALRYFRYLDLILLLFGDDALMRPLALTDLTKREMRYLRKGQMQLLPSRDRAGRRIYAFSGCDDWHFNIREKYRTNIYLIDVLSDDVPTQSLGAVSLNAPRVRYDLGDNPFGFEGMTLRMGKQELLGGKCTEAQFFRKINEAVPIRFSAIHYFAPQTLIYNIGRAIILSLLGKEHRKIVRFHAGSVMECNYSLRSFGIPHEDITITEGNNIKTKNVQKFINGRRAIESYRERQRERKLQQQRSPLNALPSSNNNQGETDEESPGIECPGVDCIVFGDKTMNGLPANVEFRELLKVMERKREEQLQSCKGSVLPIKKFIESIIEEASTKAKFRFLVLDKKTGLFVDIRDQNELCKRVSQALRDQRKRVRIEDQKLMTASSSSKSGNISSHSSSTIESSSSLMGMEAVKRLRRSYQNSGSSSNSSTGSSNTSVNSCLFRTR